MDGHIVLLGLMGSGKTTVGAALADRLGRPHRDSDADIERAQGRTGRAIAATDGVEHLHVLEARHLQDALASEEPAVISAAAFVVEDPGCATALEDPAVHVVWLRGQPETLADRASTGEHRRDAGDVAALAARRAPLFTRVADTTIDVDALSADEIAERLSASIETR